MFLGAKEDLYPSCECQSWKRNLLPCKHLIAIFENFEEFDWHSLPIKYTTSPYFNLDNNVINTVRIKVNDTADDGSYPVGNDQPIMIDLPTKKYPKRTKASSCREVLNQIKSLTYLVNDMDVLDALEEKLKTALDYLQLNSPQEEGLFIESANIKSRVKLSKISVDLPKPKKLKSNLTGRLGIAVEKKRVSVAFTLPTVSDVSKHAVVEEEIAPVDYASYDIQMHDGLKEWSEQEKVEERKERTNKETTKTKRPLKEDDEEEVVITGTVEAHGVIKKRRKLDLSKEEKDAIIGKEMLSDESINIAQNLLKQQFPNLNGLVDTSVGKCQEFDIIPAKQRYVQILHAGSLHWVCVASVKENENNQSHQIYDSLVSNKIKLDVIEQIADYSFCSKEELLLEIMPVQQQKNGVDCGLFAIAFATSLAFHEDPSVTSYDVERLRPHLVKCLEEGKLTMFPKLAEGKRVIRCRQQMNAVELFCSCRKPWRKNNDPDFDMVQCSQCSEWYHKLCERIPESCV